MSFREFLGNAATVTRLRESVRSGHVPQAMILAGPRGAGKYTLALMLAQAVNCLHPTESDGLPDFCGQCANCVRIGEAANLEDRVAEAIAAREDLRETDKKDTRILIQTHPDVLVVPPDPPQLLIKLGQVRQVIHNANFRPPVEARRAFTIFTSSAFMKEAAKASSKFLGAAGAHFAHPAGGKPQELLPPSVPAPSCIVSARFRPRKLRRCWPSAAPSSNHRIANWSLAWPRAPWAAPSTSIWTLTSSAARMR